jgi:integral membrane protein
MDIRIMKVKNTFSSFRKIALAEGVSFLVLLLIAMPLKYLADSPMAVRIVGGIHGLLFIAFIVMAFEVKKAAGKDWGWMIRSLVASVLPFGTFVMDRQWKKEEAAIVE